MGRKSAEQVAERALKARRIPRSRLQYGALCYKRTKKGVKVLLITTLQTRRWTCPKGWPMKGRGPAETAAREAFEEAGVKGRVSGKTLGFYAYEKALSPRRKITCVVQVFPLEVEERKKKFPERGARRAKWMRPRKAARRVQEPELARLIRKFGDKIDG